MHQQLDWAFFPFRLKCSQCLPHFARSLAIHVSNVIIDLWSYVCLLLVRSMCHMYSLRSQTGHKQVNEKQTVARSGIVEVSTQSFLLSCPASELSLPHQFPGPWTPPNTHTHAHTHNIDHSQLHYAIQAGFQRQLNYNLKTKAKKCWGLVGAAVGAQILTE